MTGARSAPAPRLSVVVPTLGRRGAPDAVHSVLDSAAAAGVAVEVVLVWQGSEGAPALPSGAVAVWAFPAGVSHARNRGIAAAGADLLAFVDDDVVVERGWVAAVLAAFADGAAAVAGPILPADDVGFPHCHLAGDEVRRHDAPTRRPWELASGANLAVRGSLLRALGGFDVRMGAGSFGRSAEDTELVARILRRRAELRWQPGMVVRHPTKTAAERLRTRRPYGFGVGRMTRRLRAPDIAASYGLDLSRSLVTAARARDRRRARELAASGAGFLAGAATPDRWFSPSAALQRLPDAVREALGRRRLRPWPVPHRGSPHFLWAGGEDLVLHLHLGASDGFGAGEAARARARASGISGVPELVALAAEGDVCWILEERMAGRHGGDGWWVAAADWAVGLASTGGAALRTTAWWERTARTPALARLGDLPAVVVHGDLQAKNVLVGPGGAPAILDWEGALDAGPPGFDLLLLAVAAHRGATARIAAVHALASGRDPEGTPIQARLRSVGLGPGEVRSALTVALDTWIADERARRRQLGAPPQPPEFAALATASAYTAS